MTLNEQRLKLWLSGEIAAYNDGTPKSIEMIKELCRQTSDMDIPVGDSCLYWCDKSGWGSGGDPELKPNQPVSWFFEQEPAPPTIEQRLESIEKQLAEIRAFLVL